MNAVLTAWAISAWVLSAVALMIGTFAAKGSKPLAILLDERGRFSLTHLQLLLWTIVIGSLLAGLVFGRLAVGVRNPAEISVPGPVIALFAVASGSALTASLVKAGKDLVVADRIAASGPQDPPRLAQVLLVEEGAAADRAVDVLKFQAFALTVLLVAAYVALSIHTIAQRVDAAAVRSMPSFPATLVILLGISQAAYVLGRLSPKQGKTAGLTIANRNDPPRDLVARNGVRAVAGQGA